MNFDARDTGTPSLWFSEAWSRRQKMLLLGDRISVQCTTDVFDGWTHREGRYMGVGWDRGTFSMCFIDHYGNTWVLPTSQIRVVRR